VGRIDAQSAGRMITLSARPEPVHIAVGRSAVVVVDMQNDFGARGGMFDRAGIDIAPIERVVEPTARVLDAARAAGVPVVYLTMQFSPDLAQLGSEDSPNQVKHHRLALGTTMTAPDGRPGRILVEGTWNTVVFSKPASTPFSAPAVSGTSL
jgi:ureidoacrylate peracid hydrolase